MMTRGPGHHRIQGFSLSCIYLKRQMEQERMRKIYPRFFAFYDRKVLCAVSFDDVTDRRESYLQNIEMYFVTSSN